MLSHGIPAESLATGANAVPKWGVSRNFDMAKDCSVIPKQTSTDSRASANQDSWIHSYFIQYPMSKTYKLYEKLVSQINPEMAVDDE